MGNSWGAFGLDQPQRTKKQKSKRRLRLILDIKLYFWAVFGLVNNPSDLFLVIGDAFQRGMMAMYPGPCLWEHNTMSIFFIRIPWVLLISSFFPGRIYFTSERDSLGVTAGHGEEKSVRYKDISSEMFNRWVMCCSPLHPPYSFTRVAEPICILVNQKAKVAPSAQQQLDNMLIDQGKLVCRVATKTEQWSNKNTRSKKSLHAAHTQNQWWGGFDRRKTTPTKSSFLKISVSKTEEMLISASAIVPLQKAICNLQCRQGFYAETVLTLWVGPL